MSPENNILLANFMGAKYDKDTSFPMHQNDLWLPFHGICNYKQASNGKRLQYYSNWNWLMQVVENIENIRKDEEGYNDVVAYVRIENQYCEIAFVDAIQEKCIEVCNETKIGAVYNACIEFVKWYNNQKWLK